MDDCPIPARLDLNRIYPNIKSALTQHGFSGELSIKAYAVKLPQDNVDVGIMFVPKDGLFVAKGELLKGELLYFKPS